MSLKQNIAIILLSFLISSAQALEFELLDLSGNTHTQKNYPNKYLIVNFWATWCPPCLKEIPLFVKFQKEHTNKVQFLGINAQDITVKNLKKFIKEHNINYPIFPYNSQNAIQFKKIVGLPTTYIYSPQGKLIKTFVGEVRELDLINIIKHKKSPSFLKRIKNFFG
ncbi:Cytochrome c-type biogenesis protein ResA [hydrothermal vent metagenome]|uniref:Cytochrome c-type biogenesis protein ResA n=1 Tax=hydrothermal vent metagenome TaxID=652676 RepID=A0A1W1BYR2_9ZZZZ